MLDSAAGPERIVQPKVPDRLNDPREHKTERQDQRRAVVRAAKPHESIGGVAEAEQRATYFKIEIGVRRTGRAGLSQVKDERQKDREQDDSATNEEARAHNPGGRGITFFPEKPCDFAPTTHEIPQMPKKTGNNLGMQVRDLYCSKFCPYN
jgi:hypothetical protein